MLAGLPPESHQGLHVPDNNKRFTSGSCPGAEKKGFQRLQMCDKQCSGRKTDSLRFTPNPRNDVI